MTILKKIIQSLLIILLIILLTLPFWINLVPVNCFSFLIGRFDFIDNQLCQFSTQIKGEAMAPLIKPNSSVKFDRCFQTKDLNKGTVVLYQDGSTLHVGIIRHVVPSTPIVYKLSNERESDSLQDATETQIKGINKEIDTSSSAYQSVQEAENFVLKSSEYLRDIYLGRIPKGSGIENSDVQKTNQFSSRHDKFCFVISPKKRLAGVDLEIVSNRTQNKIVLGEEVIFGLDPDPNINCFDLAATGSSTHSSLGLEEGSYQFRFILNHQLLESLDFQIY